MKLKLKQLVSVGLALALLLSCVGCTELGQNGQPLPTPTPAQSQSQEFEEYLMDEFREVVGDNLFDCRFMVKDPATYGITDVPLDFGSFNFEEYDDPMKYWQEDYDELTAFNYDTLTQEQQLIYDLLKYDMELSKTVMDYPYLAEYNSPLLGNQSQLPSLLPEFKLYTVQDAYDYITMLEHLPDYFEDMLEFQRRKSASGSFMSDTMARELIQSCKNVIEKPEENAVITTFPERIETLPDITPKELEQLTELNKKAFLEKIVPAYQDFITGIEGLLGTGTNEGGLSGLKGGKAYYEYLAKSGTGSDRTVTEMARMLDDAVKKSMSIAFYTLEDDPEAWDRLINFEKEYGTPQEIMKTLEKRTASDFPQVPNLSYQIKTIAPELEEHSSPAFFIIPQLDDPLTNAVYINNKYTKDDPTYLFTTLAHEGYPGHMYQHSYFNATNPHPIRRLLGSSGYAEGWASYVESLAYDMTGIDDASLVTLLEWNGNLSLLLSSRADIGVNYEGWGKTELGVYLADFGFSGEVVDNIFDAVVQDPANYLNYSIGMLEMQKLRRYAETELELDFDAKGFHEAVLKIGPAPFPFVKESVDEYIAVVKAANKPAKAA